MPRADNLTAFMWRFSSNLGASNFWRSQGPVQEFTSDSYVSPVHGIKHKNHIFASSKIQHLLYFTLVIRSTFADKERSQNVGIYIINGSKTPADLICCPVCRGTGTISCR